MLDKNDKPEGLQDFVVRSITRSILKGDLRPGERLSPGRLASDLGVSHIPVREALAALQALGHVEHVPRVGFFVAELSFDDIEDIYHWRRVLEDEAHAITVPLLTRSDLKAMRQVHDQMVTAVRQGNERRFVELNRRFHFIPFAKVGSERLTRFLTHLWDAAARYQAVMARARVPAHVLQDQHGSLMEAFEAKDADKVNAIMTEHRQVTLTVMRDSLVAADDREEKSK